jgi:hypothetical protein
MVLVPKGGNTAANQENMIVVCSTTSIGAHFVLTVHLVGYDGGGDGGDEDRTLLVSEFGQSKFFDHQGYTRKLGSSATYVASELIIKEYDVDHKIHLLNACEAQALPSLMKEVDVFAFTTSWWELDTADGHSVLDLQLSWQIGESNPHGNQCPYNIRWVPSLQYQGFPPVLVCCGKLVITTEISSSDKYQRGVSVVQGGVSESMMGATASVLQSQI